MYRPFVIFSFLTIDSKLVNTNRFYLLIVNLIDLITVPFSIFMRLLSVFVQLVLICLCVYLQQILKQSVEKAPLDGEFWSVSLVLLLKLTRCSICYRMNFIRNSISLNEYYKILYTLQLRFVTNYSCPLPSPNQSGASATLSAVLVAYY